MSALLCNKSTLQTGVSKCSMSVVRSDGFHSVLTSNTFRSDKVLQLPLRWKSEKIRWMPRPSLCSCGALVHSCITGN